MEKSIDGEAVSYQELIESVLPKMLEIGISLNESRVYIALLIEPEIPASRLCEITGIPDSKIYGIIDSALKLNMIEVQYGVPRLYRATAPAPFIAEVRSALRARFDNGISISEDIEARLQGVWLKTNENFPAEDGIEIAYVVKGTTNIISKMKEMIFSARYDVMAILPDFSKFSAIREQLLDAKLRGSRIKVAMPEDVIKKVSDSNSDKFSLSILSQQCSETWLILADGRLLTVSGKGTENEVSAILTRDKVLVQMSEAYFENPSCCMSV